MVSLDIQAKKAWLGLRYELDNRFVKTASARGLTFGPWSTGAGRTHPCGLCQLAVLQTKPQ